MSQDFHQFAAAHGLIIAHVEQGRWVRCGTEDKPSKRNGGYFHGGDYASIINWATMTEHVTWFPDKPMNEIDRADMQKRMEASHKAYAKERGIKQVIAAKKAKWILQQTELDFHAYLSGKGFPEMLGNVWRRPEQDPLLVIPMFYNAAICGCQLIGTAGEKKFLSGQRTNDATFTIGQTGRAFIVEGYASALSLNAILAAAKVPATIYTTFSVGNASRLARRCPAAFWIADNDVSGVGQKAAAESGLKWWMPPVTGTDVNDYHQAVGLFKASQILRKQL